MMKSASPPWYRSTVSIRAFSKPSESMFLSRPFLGVMRCNYAYPSDFTLRTKASTIDASTRFDWKLSASSCTIRTKTFSGSKTTPKPSVLGSRSAKVCFWSERKSILSFSYTHSRRNSATTEWHLWLSHNRSAGMSAGCLH